MNFSHPYTRYGLALVLQKEELNNIEDISAEILEKYLEEGLSSFRMQTNSDPEIDTELNYSTILINTIINNKIKGNPKKGIYLCPNIVTNDMKATNTWNATLNLIKKLPKSKDIFSQVEKITMGIAPTAGEVNNGTKSKKNAQGTLLEAVCSAVATTTPTKPYLSYREKGRYVHTTVIPDLELEEMKIFIEFYTVMLTSTINQNKLLTKKIYRKEGKKPKFSRPPIYNGNFPYAPYNSDFGVVALLGAIGRWSKEANYHEKGQRVLESLKDKRLYIIQYSNAQSITINHYIIDLAKENKLSEIVFSIQRSKIIHPFDERNPKDSKGVESRKNVFNLFSSRFLQLFNKPAFKDFISVRAEYNKELIELFNIFFIKQMGIKKETVDSVRALGLWLNYVAYKVAQKEAQNQNKPDKLAEFKAKTLIELESAVFAARKPAELIGNVITRAGRLSGMDAPAESKSFQEAVLTELINLDDAKSMLMAYARTRNAYEKTENQEKQETETQKDEFHDPSVSE